MNEVLYYVEYIGKILAIGISIFSVVWSLIPITKVYLEKLKIAVENKDSFSYNG